MHGLEALAQIIDQGILWKQFTEAVRVMQLDYHEDANQHFQNLVQNFPNLRSYVKFYAENLRTANLKMA